MTVVHFKAALVGDPPGGFYFRALFDIVRFDFADVHLVSALVIVADYRCRGLKVLVELLDEDYALNKDLVLSALEGIDSVFELQVGWDV
jgi:hypothetical protein